MLPEELYQTIVDNVPVLCIDVIPVKRVGNTLKIGVITRATGSQTGKWAILGGRVFRGELLPDAMRWHIEESFGPVRYHLLSHNTLEHPFHVQQYAPATHAQPPLGFDPSKHAIALTYLIELHNEPSVAHEASSFHWMTEEDIPVQAAYNQQVVMQAAFRQLEKL